MSVYHSPDQLIRKIMFWAKSNAVFDTTFVESVASQRFELTDNQVKALKRIASRWRVPGTEWCWSHDTSTVERDNPGFREAAAEARALQMARELVKRKEIRYGQQAEAIRHFTRFILPYYETASMEEMSEKQWDVDELPPFKQAY